MKVVIRQAWNRAGLDIWFLRETGNGYRLAKPTELEFGDETTGASMLPEPTFQITRMDWETLTKSISEEMIHNGWNKSSLILEGELVATKRHLSDMRALVFETKPAKREPE